MEKGLDLLSSVNEMLYNHSRYKPEWSFCPRNTGLCHGEWIGAGSRGWFFGVRGSPPTHLQRVRD